MPETLTKNLSKQLLSSIDGIVFDCDGVIYCGNSLIDGADVLIKQCLSSGKKVKFVTNNATKSTSQLLEKFQRLGITGVDESMVMSAAISTALYLRKTIPNNSKVYVVGSEGLHSVLQEFGFTTLGKNDDNLNFDDVQNITAESLDCDVKAVVASFDGKINYGKIHKAGLYVRDLKAAFVATNRDPISPLVNNSTLYPGGGTIVSAVETCAGIAPVVCGKPSKTLAALISDQLGLSDSPGKVLMVGDRINTDVAFGKCMCSKTLLVLSGATSEKELNETPIIEKPDFVASSVKVLTE